jgi:hypothetical protein
MLKALFIGIMLMLLTLALAIGFIVAFVFGIAALGTVVERAIKNREKIFHCQPDRLSSGSISNF